MRVFLKRIIFFTLVTAVVFAAADYCLSRYDSHSSSPNMEIWRDVMEGGLDADIVALGDSRVSTDFVPWVIDSISGHSSFNLGVIGYHFPIQRIRYEMFAKRNGNPELLLHFVDNWTFTSAVAKFDKWQFMPWMWSMDFMKSALRSSPRFFITITLPWFRYHGYTLSGLTRKRSTVRGYYPNGPENFTPKWESQEMTFLDDEAVRERYREFLSEVKAEGVGIVLIIPPFSDEMVFSPGEKEKMRNRFALIAKELDLPLLDYCDMGICKDTTFFFDECHLKPKGARIFSDTLANDIKRLGLVY